MARATREQYYEAGLDLLAEAGPEALTLSTVCERVGVTKGSFYHHFDSMAALHEGMLAHWVAGRGRPVPDEVQRGEGTHRLTALRLAAVTSDHETEVAIRAWAAWYPPAAEAVRDVEHRRRHVLARTFEELGIDEAHAATLARVGLYLMAGVQSDVDKVDRARLDEVLTEYQRWIEASLPPT